MSIRTRNIGNHIKGAGQEAAAALREACPGGVSVHARRTARKTLLSLRGGIDSLLRRLDRSSSTCDQGLLPAEKKETPPTGDAART